MYINMQASNSHTTEYIATMAVSVETVLTQSTKSFEPEREDFSDGIMLDLRLKHEWIFIRWIEEQS